MYNIWILVEFSSPCSRKMLPFWHIVSPAGYNKSKETSTTYVSAPLSDKHILEQSPAQVAKLCNSFQFYILLFLTYHQTIVP